MDVFNLEPSTLTRRLELTLREDMRRAQHMCAAMLRHLLLHRGLLAEVTDYQGGAAAVRVHGAGEMSMLVVPARAWLQAGFDAQKPAPWVALVVDNASGRRLPSPTQRVSGVISLAWARMCLGADIGQGLRFVDRAMCRAAAAGFVPVQVPRGELEVS